MRNRTYIVGLLLLLAIGLGTKYNARAKKPDQAAQNALDNAKAKLALRLAESAEHYQPENLCEKSRCVHSITPWCKSLLLLNENQATRCRDYLSSNLGTMTKMITGAEPIEVKLSNESLMVDESGKEKKVDALTQTQLNGPIVLSEESARKLSTEQLMAILIHEYGHKLPYQGKFIRDEDAVEFYANGREFLDTVAAALMAHMENNFIVGFFRVGETGYYGNSEGHYCQIESAKQWEQLAGALHMEKAPNYNSIPERMIKDGTCH